MVKLPPFIILRKLLYKLGIKTAQVTWIEESMATADESFGRPEKMYLDPESFKQIQKLIKDKK